MSQHAHELTIMSISEPVNAVCATCCNCLFAVHNHPLKCRIICDQLKNKEKCHRRRRDNAMNRIALTGTGANKRRIYRKRDAEESLIVVIVLTYIRVQPHEMSLHAFSLFGHLTWFRVTPDYTIHIVAALCQRRAKIIIFGPAESRWLGTLYV